MNIFITSVSACSAISVTVAELSTLTVDFIIVLSLKTYLASIMSSGLIVLKKNVFKIFPLQMHWSPI